MTLFYPSALLILLGIPLLIFAQLREYRSNRQDLIRIGGSNENVQSVLFLKWFLSSLCMLFTYVFLVFSLAGVSWGEQPVEEDHVGIDMVYLVDISYSMLAEDVKPNRLARAKELIWTISEKISGLRMGLVVFKGEGTMLLPPTEDIHALENALGFVNTEVISTPGSNLEAALTRAIEVFPEGSNRHRIIMLFSDGEALSGNINNPALIASRQGILVFTYGLGSRDGAPIPQGEGFVTKDGETVITRINSTVLQNIAQLTKGSYYDESMGSGLLIQDIIRVVEQRDSDGFRLTSVPRYSVLLLLALLAYIAHILIRSVKIKGLF